MDVTEHKKAIQMKWKPKRWWIGLIIFGLLSIVGSKIIMYCTGPTDSDVSFTAPGLVMMIFAIWTAFTDKKRPVSKRILFVILVSLAYSFCSGIFALLLRLLLHFVEVNASESFLYLVVTFPFVVYVMRRSNFFVEPAVNTTQT